MPVYIEEEELPEGDILCKRGRKSFQWPGNVRFRQLLGQVSQAIGSADYDTERYTRLAQGVFNTLRSEDRKFVRQQEGRWYVLSKEKSVEKIRHALRDCRTGRRIRAQSEPRLEWTFAGPARTLRLRRRIRAQNEPRLEWTLAARPDQAEP